MGEQKNTSVTALPTRIGVDTYAGKVHVEWDPNAAVTPLGKLPFFI